MPLKPTAADAKPSAPDLIPVQVPALALLAATYFLSALLRAVTATLAPVFSAELGLQASDLGLLAGAFFFGFSLTQLPLGRALDTLGPRRTLVGMLALAVLGCGLFALASNLAALVAARVLIGAGLGACLMAALTTFRRMFSLPGQQRANAWMLMTGSFGMVASTLPVQWLLPSLGWRGLFWSLSAALLVAMAGLALTLPRDPQRQAAVAGQNDDHGGYRHIVRHPLFLRLAPMAFFIYGGLIAVQTLWAGPWLTRLGGLTPTAAAQGLLAINTSMLVAFALWGWLTPLLSRRGLDSDTLMRRGVPLSLGLLLLNIAAGPSAGAAHWALWCVSSTFVALAQPAVGAAFAAGQAGRALSAFNLVIFSGVFAVQWGIGLLIDGLRSAGLAEVQAFRCAFVAFAACCVASYLWFLRKPAAGHHNPG